MARVSPATKTALFPRQGGGGGGIKKPPHSATESNPFNPRWYARAHWSPPQLALMEPVAGQVGGAPGSPAMSCRRLWRFCTRSKYQRRPMSVMGCSGPPHTVHSLQDEQFKTPCYLSQGAVEGSAKTAPYPLCAWIVWIYLKGVLSATWA